MKDLAIVITTFNKPAEVIANLQDLAKLSSNSEASFLHTVLIIDQGDDKVEAHLKAQGTNLGDLPITFINQGNFGGSGGFTRGMIEALKQPDVQYVMLLDDDARIDLPSLQKVYQVARDNPNTIIGAPMLQPGEATQQKPYLYPNYGELINRKIWGLEPQTTPGGDIDFTGWWMTLLPRNVIEKIGLPLPLFIKWDDAEYGLRAKTANIPMIVPEYVGVFHENWRNTPQRYGWQSYYWQRNKFIVALLYAEKAPLWAIFLNMLILLKMSILRGLDTATTIRLQAMEDLLNTELDLFANLEQTHQKLFNVTKGQQSTGKSRVQRLKALRKTIVTHFTLLKNWRSLSDSYQKSLNCRHNYSEALQKWQECLASYRTERMVCPLRLKRLSLDLTEVPEENSKK